ncbi:hypothetical protein [Curtobacterium sp. L1-20]
MTHSQVNDHHEADEGTPAAATTNTDQDERGTDDGVAHHAQPRSDW